MHQTKMEGILELEEEKWDLNADSTTRFKCEQIFIAFWDFVSPFGEHEK